MLSDSEFTFELCQRAAKYKCFAAKINFILQDGAPDFILCDAETGQSITFELKIRGDKMSSAQRRIAEKMGAAYNLLWINGANEFIYNMKLSENMKKLFNELKEILA